MTRLGLVVGHANEVLRPIAPAHASGQRSLTGIRIRTDSPEQASAAFDSMLERFSKPHTWFQSPRIPDALKLNYQLSDAHGIPVSGRGPALGDHGRVAMGASETVDWVRIEAVGIDAAQGHASMTFRPARAPIGATRDGEITHFYTDDASNTMTLRRDGSDFIAAVDVRGVHHNTHEAAATGRKLRNQLYGVGTEAGGQKWTWDTWVSESVMAGLRGANMTRGDLLRDPSRVTGAATFLPDYVRDIGRALRGQPSVARDDAKIARELIPYAW